MAGNQGEVRKPHKIKYEHPTEYLRGDRGRTRTRQAFTGKRNEELPLIYHEKVTHQFESGVFTAIAPAELHNLVPQAIKLTEALNNTPADSLNYRNICLKFTILIAAISLLIASCTSLSNEQIIPTPVPTASAIVIEQPSDIPSQSPGTQEKSGEPATPAQVAMLDAGVNSGGGGGEVTSDRVAQVPTEAPLPTEAPPPTPEAAPPEVIPEAPEMPFRVENGIVQKWTFNTDTNQEEWVVDESFPQFEPQPGRSKVEIERTVNDKYGLIGAFSKHYNELVAIHMDGTWKKVDDINPAEFVVSEFAPGTLTPVNPEWMTEYEMIPEGANQAYRSFWETVISQNQDYFRWLTGSGDISLDNALRVANENHGGLFPLPPEGSGVQPIRILTWGPEGRGYVSHDRKRGAEVTVAINPTNMGFLVFDSEEYKSNIALQVFIKVVSHSHLLSSFATPAYQETGIIVLSNGNIVYLHGVQDYNPHRKNYPDISRYMRAITIGDEEEGAIDPSTFSHVMSAFFQAYLEAMRAENTDKAYIPLDFWASAEIQTGGTYGAPVTQPVFVGYD